MKLLLVEDDPTMRVTLQRSLVRRGMQVDTAGDGVAALAQWSALSPDAVLLDLTLPGLDGLEVLRLARERGLRAPVVILTARGTVGDRVVGLNAGADDYLPKPFDLDELEARLRALLRRRGTADTATTTGPPQHDAGSATAGALRYDKASGAIYRHGNALELTPRELALLQALMHQPGQAVAKERLFSRVFPDEADVQFKAIEVVAYRLRKKLVGCGVQLVTLRGLGYLLKVGV